MRSKVLTMAALLLSASYVIADNCSDSPYWLNQYQEKINDDLCLTISNVAGATKAIMVDTNKPSYLGLDRVWLEIYDWNGDNSADWIRISNYFGGTWQEGFYFPADSAAVKT